jgi:L-arabinokinase
VLWRAVLQNLCVGAPCGVMDQMTAALGEAGQLTALLCQPAELQAGVQIPPQVGRGWGRGIVGCTDTVGVGE